jgi:long-chain acyl-CoA synthetase
MAARYLDAPAEAGSLDGWSIPGLLRDRSVRDPHAAAVRFKRRGIYHSLTWQDLWTQAATLAAALRNLGLAAEDRVGLMAGPDHRAIIAEHAVWAAGAISVGIYPTASAKDIANILDDSAPAFLVVEAQEHLDRICALAAHLGSVKAIIALNAPDAESPSSSIKLVRIDSLLAGASAAAGKMLSDVNPDAIACITYTSGTTGRAKGVMHSHRTMLYSADCKRVLVPALLEREQRTIVSVPFTHVSPKASAILLPLITYLVPSLPESADSVRQTIIDTQPTYIVQPPRFYEKVVQDVTHALGSIGGVRRRLYRWAMKVAGKVVHDRWDGRTPLPHRRALYWLACAIVFKPILRNFGYHKLTHGYVGSAPTSSDLTFVWHCWGLDLRESYGLTESGGNITGQQWPFPRPGNVGPVLRRKDYHIKIAPDGELLFKGPSNFIGYWNNPEATAKTLVDGWLHTGDLVTEQPDGSIALIGRKSQVIVTTGGKTLNPETIEAAIKSSPLILEAVAVGHGRQFVVAMVEPALEALVVWARDNGIATDSYGDLVRRPEVHALMAREIDRANAALGRVERVRKFVIAPVQLATVEGLHTALQKVKRDEVVRRFNNLIEPLYVETADLKVG